MSLIDFSDAMNGRNPNLTPEDALKTAEGLLSQLTDEALAELESRYYSSDTADIIQAEKLRRNQMAAQKKAEIDAQSAAELADETIGVAKAMVNRLRSEEGDVTADELRALANRMSYLTEGQLQRMCNDVDVRTLLVAVADSENIDPETRYVFEYALEVARKADVRQPVDASEVEGEISRIIELNPIVADKKRTRSERGMAQTKQRQVIDRVAASIENMTDSEIGRAFGSDDARAVAMSIAEDDSMPEDVKRAFGRVVDVLDGNKAEQQREQPRVEPREPREYDVEGYDAAMRAFDDERADAQTDGQGGGNSTQGAEVRPDESHGKPTLLDAVRDLYTYGKGYASNKYRQTFFDMVETPDFIKKYGLTGDKFTIRYGVIARHSGKDASHDGKGVAV